MFQLPITIHFFLSEADKWCLPNLPEFKNYQFQARVKHMKMDYLNFTRSLSLKVADPWVFKAECSGHFKRLYFSGCTFSPRMTCSEILYELSRHKNIWHSVISVGGF